MEKIIIKIIEKITFNKIRGQHYFEAKPSLLWWWTPFTYNFNHGGWIFLNIKWFLRFWNYKKRNINIQGVNS